MTEDHKHVGIPMDQVIAEELAIIGSHGMQAHCYPEMLDMILDGRLHPDLLISHSISLEEGAQALMKMNQFNHSGVLVIDDF